MKNYTFTEKNGNAVIILSEENEEQAIKYFENIVKYPEDFRMEEVE